MMIDNSKTLREGAAKARAIIGKDMTIRLSSLMYGVVEDLRNRVAGAVGGMTGNTWESPAGAVYVDGVMEETYLGNKPMMGKLKPGMKFYEGVDRYDGTIQNRTFTADTDTSGNEARLDKYDFLESQQSGKGFKMTVTGGTEYFPGMEQLVDNYLFCQQEADRYFK